MGEAAESGDVTDAEDQRHVRFVKSLPAEEYQLLILREELYDGAWSEMRRDLEDRRDGKPFIYKLANRIDEDLRRIERLVEYEDSENVNLGDYLGDD